MVCLHDSTVNDKPAPSEAFKNDVFYTLGCAVNFDSADEGRNTQNFVHFGPRCYCWSRYRGIHEKGSGDVVSAACLPLYELPIFTGGVQTVSLVTYFVCVFLNPSLYIYLSIYIYCQNGSWKRPLSFLNFQKSPKSISANPFLQNTTSKIEYSQLFSNQWVTWQKNQYILHE